MWDVVTQGEKLWAELASRHLPPDHEFDLTTFRTSVVKGLQGLHYGELGQFNAGSLISSGITIPRKKKDIVYDYGSFFSYAWRGLEDTGIDPQQVFPHLPDLEQILQKEVHPPRFLPTIARYTPTIGALVFAVAGAVGGGHLFDYFFDNETVAYLGSGIGTVVGGIAGGFLAHAARLPLARYLSAVDKQQTRHAYDIFLEQMEGWMSRYQPTQ